MKFITPLCNDVTVTNPSARRRSADGIQRLGIAYDMKRPLPDSPPITMNVPDDSIHEFNNGPIYKL
jgi:hypothetical protein